MRFGWSRREDDNNIEYTHELGQSLGRDGILNRQTVWTASYYLWPRWGLDTCQFVVGREVPNISTVYFPMYGQIYYTDWITCWLLSLSKIQYPHFLPCSHSSRVHTPLVSPLDTWCKNIKSMERFIIRLIEKGLCNVGLDSIRSSLTCDSRHPPS